MVFGHDVNRRVTSVPRALNIIIYCTALRGKMRLTGEAVQRDRLELALTTLYSYQDLLNWFPSVGWRPVWHRNEAGVGLFLLTPEH